MWVERNLHLHLHFRKFAFRMVSISALCYNICGIISALTIRAKEKRNKAGDNMSKKARREKALKKEKQKKTNIIIIMCVSLALVVISFFIYNALQQKDDRIFTDGQQTVTLHTDGTFTARLAHDSRTGTYTEKKEKGVTTVSFITEGTTVTGDIANDVLTIPDEWDDHHGHGAKLKLKK